MLEILFLLLPLAAAYGWYMGYRSARQEKQKQSHHISRQYMAGLNLLLSDQSDKAVDHFIELLDIEDETIDTHLALGNLFRSRGEVDRAIRIHENLLSRSSLTIDQKNLALQQLAKDYMVSGFLDRAESILEQLLDEPDHRESALRQLIMIYQQTREWWKAIDCIYMLSKEGRAKMGAPIAHFFCELAGEALARCDDSKATLYYQKALTEDPQCVRASIEMGKMYLEKSDYTNTIANLTRVLDQDADFVSEILPILADCYKQMGRENDFISFLYRCIEQQVGGTAELMLSNIVAEHESTAAALDLLTQQLAKNPTMKGFYQLMDYHLLEAEEGRAKESLSVLQGMVGEQIRLKPDYRCRKCGFSSHSLYWQCPSCKTWGKVKPIRGLDGE